MIGADEARIEGLRAAAVIFTGKRACAHEVSMLAGELARRLMAPPARLVLRPAPFTFAEGRPGPGVPTKYLGDGMSVTMTDDQQVTYSVAAVDDKGNPTSDAITWSVDDDTVLTFTTSDDSMSATFVGGEPGTATVTASDGTLSASDLVTVTPGGAASLVLSPGAPEAQPALPSA